MATKETKAAEPGTAVVTWRDKMAAVTKQAASSEAPKGGFLSFKGGNMSYDDVPIPGNVLKVVVVDFLLENAIFKEKYNPNKPASPMCYAFGRDEEDLAPHPDAPEPQNADCATCPNNEWASDPEGGRGKACKNGRVLALIPGDTKPDAVPTAEIALLKPPVTSIKNYQTYVQKLAAVYNRPPLGVLTEISTVPDQKSQYKVVFTDIGVLDISMIKPILDRVPSALDACQKVYEYTEPAPAGEAKQRKM